MHLQTWESVHLVSRFYFLLSFVRGLPLAGRETISLSVCFRPRFGFGFDLSDCPGPLFRAASAVVPRCLWVGTDLVYSPVRLAVNKKERGIDSFGKPFVTLCFLDIR